jgi:hypothetical protein
MRKTNFAAIAAGALILAGIAGWVSPSNLPVKAKVSTSIQGQIDTLSIMSTAKNLPTEEFQDFSLIFLSPVQTKHP